MFSTLLLGLGSASRRGIFRCGVDATFLASTYWERVLLGHTSLCQISSDSARALSCPTHSMFNQISRGSLLAGSFPQTMLLAFGGFRLFFFLRDENRVVAQKVILDSFKRLQIARRNPAYWIAVVKVK